MSDNPFEKMVDGLIEETDNLDKRIEFLENELDNLDVSDKTVTTKRRNVRKRLNRAKKKRDEVAELIMLV